jgi:oxygen-dependent protoporphyrinogen oxidase
MGLELFIPAKRDGQDETLAEFITRRLGSEALDKIAEPLMSGIYNAEAERQSLLATFPRFRSLEEKHGSLIRGMLAGQKARSNGNSASAGSPDKDRSKLSMFVSLQNGTEQLVQELVGQLRGKLNLGTCIARLEPLDNGYQLTTGSGEKMTADAVVLAIPAYTAAGLIRDLAPGVADDLDGIRYVSTGTVSLAFRRQEVKLLEGFGLVIPRSERRLINAVTITSTKFDGRAPDDHVLLRVFFGGSRNPQMMDVNDSILVAIVLSELEALLGIDAQPIFYRIFRWHRANPQYDVGHLDRLEEIEGNLPGRLFLTGSAYRGIGLPDCVYQGKETAENVVDTLLAANGQMPGAATAPIPVSIGEGLERS